VVSGLIAIVLLPKSAATAYFLTEEEKRLAYHRIASLVRDSGREV